MSTKGEVGPGVLVVFAKAPRAGEVKTRLTPTLTPEVAAAFYGEMLADVLGECAGLCDDSPAIRSVLTVSPGWACAELAKLAPASFCVVGQAQGDLGTRMAFEVERALAGGAPKVVLRGSDNPAMGREEIEDLFRALDRFDLAASPDRDGGYGAIGLRVAPGTIFQHEMSNEDVLRATVARAQRAGLSTTMTSGSFDLDTRQDLVHLLRTREHLPANRCPRTLAFADAHQWWGIG
ncbi:MAG: glycosyltransferase [bacterium]|nr:glycosyltransferase [bacterium]